MNQQRIYWNSREREHLHQQKVIRKIEKIQGLRALLEMWEKNPELDHDYLIKLRARLRSAENQFAAMQP